MKGASVLVMFLLHFIATGYAAKQKAKCPPLPCSPCECQKMKICGGELRNGNGDLQLPSSGENSCIRCEWELSVPKNHKVRLTFSHFNLGPGDWVKVYDGSTKRSPLIVKHDSGRHPTDLVTSDRNMVVQFQSDGCGGASRFRATYQAIDCGGLIRLNPRNKRQKTVVIKSPRFPRLYPPNTNCLWTVVSTETLLSAWITVQVVDTETNNDFVRIYDSLDSEASIHSYTGRLQSVKRHETRNSSGLTIRFVSDKNVAEKGFKLTIVAAIASTCARPNKLADGLTVVLDHKRKLSYYCCSGYSMVGIGSATCVRGRWSPSSLPSCVRKASCLPPEPPDNSYIEGGKKPTALGSIVKYRCNKGFQFAGTSAEVVTATCDCSWLWIYDPIEPRCEVKTCGEPPQAPEPMGKRNISVSIPPYFPGTIVDYSCPEGSGLDGIPFRVCNRLGQWEPSTRLHKCIPNKHACRDPDTPGNGTRRIVSFLDGHMASFGCLGGYRPEGSQYRTCDASNPNDTYWSGVPVTCIDLFKSTSEVAAQWRVNIIDRTVQCVDEDEETNFANIFPPKSINITQPNSNSSLPTATVTPSNPTPTEAVVSTQTVTVNTTNFPTNSTSSIKKRRGFCRGRSVAVGEGCVDLIYAVDCSKSINKTGFNYSMEFVGSSVSLFDIDRGQANVALFTYDQKVHTAFKLGQITTTEGTVEAINAAPFCGGSTATRPVLLKIENEILKRRNESCRTVVFILSDGNNNWAGNPMDVADRIKAIPNVEIYTIAFSKSDLNWGTLRALASNPDYFIPVRNPDDIAKAVDEAHDIRIDYSTQCGTTSAPDCRARVVGGCQSKKGAWPWMVAIYIDKGNGFTFHCGGTLIDDCWVLTAAHCFRPERNRIIQTTDIVAVLGDTDRFQREFTENSYDVERIDIHTEYDFIADTYDYDVALLKLKCSVKYRSQVRKGCLPSSVDQVYYASGTSCIVAGWGHTEVVKPKVLNPNEKPVNRPMSTTLKHVTLDVQDTGHCRTTTPFPVTDNMICAGSGNTDRDNVEDACSGDSGGPLFCKRRGPGTPSYVVIGIVSWGDGCGKKNQYGYFTHVLRMMNWTDTVMERHGPCKHSFKDCPPPIARLV